MAEVDHRAIGVQAGALRKQLQIAAARKGVATQDDVAHWSGELLGAANAVARQTVSAIESGDADRAVSAKAVGVYIDVVIAVASGKTGLSPHPQVKSALRALRDVLSGVSPRAEAVAPPPASSSITIPSRAFDVTRSPPGALLRAEYGVVPFHGRETELDNLLAWCTTDRAVGLRLYTGPGGMGKTRLLIEACTALERRGWSAGFLGSRSDLDTLRAGAIWGEDRPILVVLDYAETRRDVLDALLASLFVASRTMPARVVLLARAADDWWEQLKTAGDHVGEFVCGPATDRVRLPALSLSAVERKTSYDLAAESFAGALGAPVPAMGAVDFDDPCFERVLLLHMHALSAVDGVTAVGEQGVLDFVLRREQRFWGTQARARELPRAVDGLIGQGLALVTLAGGVDDEAELTDLLAQLPLAAGQPHAVLKGICTLLRELYGADRYVDPVMPDLLGEHLVQTQLASEPEQLLSIVLGPRSS